MQFFSFPCLILLSSLRCLVSGQAVRCSHSKELRQWFLGITGASRFCLRRSTVSGSALKSVRACVRACVRALTGVSRRVPHVQTCMQVFPSARGLQVSCGRLRVRLLRVRHTHITHRYEHAVKDARARVPTRTFFCSHQQQGHIRCMAFQLRMPDSPFRKCFVKIAIFP